MPFVQQIFKTGVFNDESSNQRQNFENPASPCTPFPHLTVHDLHVGSSSWASVKWASSDRPFMFFCSINWTVDLHHEKTQQQLHRLCGLRINMRGSRSIRRAASQGVDNNRYSEHKQSLQECTIPFLKFFISWCQSLCEDLTITPLVLILNSWALTLCYSRTHSSGEVFH